VANYGWLAGRRVPALRAGPPVALIFLLASGPVLADGAFPDSMRILLPPDHPEQVMVGTNFGLLVSSDGGGHFRLVCEEAITRGGENVTQYQLGPGGTIYAVTSNELDRSTDACGWSAAAGTWKDPFLTDAFADPATAGHLYALALIPEAGGSVSALFESRDDGRTFADPIYRGGAGVFLTGVESALTAPGTLYVTGFDFRAKEPMLARSRDGGRTFDMKSLAPILGTGEVRLAAVDPADAKIIYYRVLDVDGDKLAISRDGGETARVALALTGEMTAFLRRADGTLLVGTRLEGAFRSTDGGATFAPWPEAPHLRGLAERSGVIYAVADNAVDPFALGSSTDGRTWTPLLRFQGICGVLACSAAVRDTCAPAWARLVQLLGIDATCAAPPDAGVDAPGPVPDAAVQPPAQKGCACASGGASRAPGALPSAVILLALLRRRRRCL
jgi:MYXO-CTERM domain-containing protein